MKEHHKTKTVLATLCSVLLASLFLAPTASAAQNTSAADTNAAGLRPLASRRHIRFGTAVAFRPVRANADEGQYVRALDGNFTMIEPENELKPPAIWTGPGQYNWSDADWLLGAPGQTGWTQEHHFQVRGHVLVYARDDGYTLPNWLRTQEAQITPDQARQYLSDYIHTVVGRYKGKIFAWDVINEAIDDNPGNPNRFHLRNSFWFRKLGPEFLKLAFQYAHEADPDAELYINEYGAEGLGYKSDAVMDILKWLKGQGVYVTGAGMQYHLRGGDSIQPSDAHYKNVQRLHAAGFAFMITELDVALPVSDGRAGLTPTNAADLDRQADVYRSLLQMALATPNCHGVQVWGFTDRHSWIPGFSRGERGAATILDGQYRPKPAYLAIERLLQTQAAPAQNVVASIDASKTSAPINKMVYGQFLEHIGNLVNSGLWAEMLDDRKFFNSIPAPPPTNGGGRFGRALLRRWTVVGPDSVIHMDTERPYVGKHSPQIALSGNEPHGIEQAGMPFVAGKEYTGRIVLAGAPNARVTVSAIWGDKPDDARSIPLGKLSSGYRTFRFRFTAPHSTDNARFRISGTGSGTLSIGAVSLMPADNIDGFRPEVIKALKQLHTPVYRFPGGNFVSAYEWRDAIGDPDRRAPTYDPVWSAVQSNDVGTDEFVDMCRLLGAEPYISVNAGFGDAYSARDLVEYCNGSVSTRMGHLRSMNGHPGPYHVKYWGIGNEMWGYSYQFGAMKLSQFVEKHNRFADAMRSVDPTIKLIGSGAMPDTMTGSGEALHLGDSLIPKPLGPADWTGGLFLHCLDKLDLISEHFYNYGGTHYDLSQGRQTPNKPDEPLVEWMRRPANHIRIKYEEYKAYEDLIPALKNKPVPICLDEWAYAGGPPNSYRVVPAYAWTFHEMFRHSDLFQMAAFTFATAMVSADHSEAVLTPTGKLFQLYRDHFGVIPVEVVGNSPQPKPTDPPGGEQPAINAGSDTFPLDVVAAWSEDRKTLTVAVLNPTESDQSLHLSINSASLTGKGMLYRMAPDSLTAVSTIGRPSQVDVSSSPVTLSNMLTLPKFSVSIYAWEAK
jgi:alpha-N-arabinofuranosidase